MTIMATVMELFIVEWMLYLTTTMNRLLLMIMLPLAKRREKRAVKVTFSLYAWLPRFENVISICCISRIPMKMVISITVPFATLVDWFEGSIIDTVITICISVTDASTASMPKRVNEHENLV